MVAQRTREIGIRMALGAGVRDVVRMVFREGMMPAVIGVVVGLGGAVALVRIMASNLRGITAEPTTYIAVSILLLAVAALACYLPARRAMRVDPMRALKYE